MDVRIEWGTRLQADHARNSPTLQIARHGDRIARRDNPLQTLHLDIIIQNNINPNNLTSKVCQFDHKIRACGTFISSKLDFPKGIHCGRWQNC